MSGKTIIGLSRLVALQLQVDRIARNVANQSTVGFKAEGVQFREYLAEAKEATPSAKSSLVSVEAYTDFSSGPLKATGSPTDVAVIGDAFFVIQTARGERYTRRGSFALDREGRLVTTTGEPVITHTGTLQVPQADGPVSIGADGRVSTAKGPIGQLRLVRFDDLRQLGAESGGSFFSSKPPINIAGNDIRLVVGAVEGSNVKSVLEMTNLIAASRAYEQVAKVVLRDEDNNELKKLAGEDL